MLEDAESASVAAAEVEKAGEEAEEEDEDVVGPPRLKTWKVPPLPPGRLNLRGRRRHGDDENGVAAPTRAAPRYPDRSRLTRAQWGTWFLNI